MGLKRPSLFLQLANGKCVPRPLCCEEAATPPPATSNGRNNEGLCKWLCPPSMPGVVSPPLPVNLVSATRTIFPLCSYSFTPAESFSRFKLTGERRGTLFRCSSWAGTPTAPLPMVVAKSVTNKCCAREHSIIYIAHKLFKNHSQESDVLAFHCPPLFELQFQLVNASVPQPVPLKQQQLASP
jgi:hypothetical protein